MGKALLVDGHSLAYRAFFALPDTLETAEGQPTNAVLGFAQMLLRVLEEERPDYVAVAFDKGRPAFRLEEFADYKAHRRPTPERLRPQFDLIKEFLDTLGATVVEVEGWEGDDVLAALTDLARREGVEVLILTGDRDTLQLVGPGVKALITLKGISETAVFDEEAVRARYGVDPARLPDLKGLAGDPSDNLPGVPGVGPKTAAGLLGRFGSLDDLLDRLDEVTPERLREALRAYAEDARMCRALATVRRDVPFAEPPSLEDLRYRGPDRDRLAAFLRRLEFRALLKRLGLTEKAAAGGVVPTETDQGGQLELFGRTATAKASPVRGRRVVRTPEELAALLPELEGLPRLALAADFEGERPTEAALRGLAVAAEGGGPTVYVPLGSSSPGAAGRCRRLEVLRPLLAADRPPKVVHSAKTLMVWLGCRGLELGGVALDTELGAYLLDATRARYPLEVLAREHLGQDILLPEKPPEGWAPAAEGLDWPSERLCLEADLTLALADPIRAELEDKELAGLLDGVEMPLERVLARMELAGVGVDVRALREMSEELGRRLEEVAREVYELAGEEFNLNSPRQLGEVLFGKLELPAGKKTATGAYSTNAEILEELAPAHPIVAKVLLHRQLSKLKSTYTDGMAPLVNPETGRLHTVFKQTATATGRLSSAEPNLQNIPVREEEGRRLRRVFVAEPGHVLLAGDYSQIELRLMAHLSGDSAFVEAFRRGEDIHQRTASEVFGVPMDEVTPELRSRAKAVNFGIIYGVSDYGLARNTGVSREEAAAYIEGYFRRYPGIRVFVEHTLAEARRCGYVKTLFGRRRYVPDLHSANRTVRQMAERAARNMPIQGTAADIIKMAMVRIDEEMRRHGLASRMILQVHDELLFEVPDAEVGTMAGLVKELMEKVVTLDVPLVVDLKVGRNWYEMKPLDRLAGPGCPEGLTLLA
ncbi:MAG: DNA polymerase I [Firmicutes bacterium]|nr:DNA polymerase I [Bacillota bacterium]